MTGEQTMTDTQPKVTLVCGLPEGMPLPLDRVTVEKLIQLKSDFDYAMDTLIHQVSRLEANGWKVYYAPDEITAYHTAICTKEAAQKRLDELDLSHWEGVLVE